MVRHWVRNLSTGYRFIRCGIDSVDGLHVCYVRTDSGYGCQLCLGCELLLYAGYSYLVPGCIDNVGYCRYGAVIGYGGGCQRIDLRTYKEELRAGKGVKAALADGYSNAFSAIFDSNLTSILTGIILFYFGTGPIRGFATTLIIGILCSFFTAVFLTRVVYEHFMNKDKWLGLTFTTGISKNLMQNVHYNFMGMMKRFVHCIRYHYCSMCGFVLYPRFGSEHRFHRRT